jgi:MFS family permease
MAASPTIADRRAERLLVPAAFVTNLGNAIQLTASAVLVLAAEGTTLSVGWLFIATAVPQVLLSMPFGRLADRLDRRVLCALADLASAATALALPLWMLLGGPLNVATYLANFILAVVAALFMPASNALIRERVEQGRLGQFNANFEVATQAGTLLACAACGFFIELFGVMPLFIFNGFTFLISAALIIALGRPRESIATPQAGHDVTSQDVPSAPSLSLPLLGTLYGVGQAIIMVSNTILVVLIVQTFRSGYGLVGVVDALAGVGILAAAATYRWVKGRTSNLRIALFGYLGCAAVMALEPFHVVGLIMLIPVSGLTFGLARVAARTELMRNVAPASAGRVFGATNAAGLVFSAAATLAISNLIDRSETRYGFFALSLLVAVVVIATVVQLQRRSALRWIPRRVPVRTVPMETS